jgi:WD40 repeat protein
VIACWGIVGGMGGDSPVDGGRDLVGRMQDGIRRLVRRGLSGGQQLRHMPPSMVLALMGAAALSPLVAAGAGVTDAVAAAGVAVLSSFGGGVLSGVVGAAVDRLRERASESSVSAEDVEREIAWQIQEVLAAGDERALALRAEIAGLLREINAGGTALREAFETGNERVRSDVVAAVGELSTGISGLHFMLSDVTAVAAEILANQDAQGAQLRVVLDRVGWAATEARLTREEAGAWRLGGGGTAGTGPARVWPRGADRCPYRGLRPFDEEDAEVFYGRERLTAQLVGEIAGQSAGPGIVVVTGASGAGKSSLIQAGLLPALARGLQLAGSERWPRMVITPTKHPLAELAIHLAARCGTDAEVLRDALARRPGQAHLAVWQAVLAEAARYGMAELDRQRLVLIVDQFEQVFTLDPDGKAEAEAFIAALCAAAGNPAGPGQRPPALVVISVRGDFWDRCAAHPELARALRDRQFIVGPMSASELRMAITGPAEIAGLQIDPSLTDTILGDLRAAGGDSEAGVLPLLSQAMLLTWDKREGNRLTSRAYEQSGGVSRAVQVSGDRVYEALPAGQQALAQQLLCSMTAASSDGRLTRRQATRHSLYGSRPAADRSQIDAVLDAFATQRLIVLDDGRVQIAHDALLTAWPRLRGWLEDDQASWVLHAQLTEDAGGWAGSGQDSSFLYRGTQLAAARQAAARWQASPGRYPALTATQQAFLDASEKASVRSSRQRQILAGVLVVLLIIAASGAVVASVADRAGNRQRNLANQQANLAVATQLSVQSEALDTADPITAAKLATAAAHFDLTQQVRDSLLDVDTQPERASLATGARPGSALAFSPDGKILAAAAGSGVVVWDVATDRQIGRPLPAGGSVDALAFDPSGKVLASADDDGVARIWDVATSREIGMPLKAGSGPSVNALAFTSRGPLLAAISVATSTMIQFWNVATHQQAGAAVDIGSPARSLTFSPDGALLGAASNDGAQVWDVSTGAEVNSLPSDTANGPDEVVFSQNGKLAASVNGVGAILSRPATGQQVGSAMPVQGGMLETAALSANGTMLATGGVAGTAELWDTADQRQVGVLQTNTTQVRALVFSAGGNLLATLDAQGQVKLWDTRIWRQIGTPLLTPNENVIYSDTAISPDSQTLAISENTGDVLLWSIRARRYTGTLMPPVSSPYFSSALAFSPNGKLLAVGYSSSDVRLWDIATRQMIGQALRLGNADGPYQLTFSPDGKILAAITSDGIELADVSTGQLAGRLAGERTDTMAFTSDGKTLVTTTSDGAQMWDIATHREIGAFPIPIPPDPYSSNSGIGPVAFSPSGKILAVANLSSVQLWNITTHRQVGTPLNIGTAEGYASALVFSPNGQFLAAAVGNGISVWDISTNQQIGATLTYTPGQSGLSFPAALTFSHDQTTLVGTNLGDIWLWNVALPKNPVAAACSIADVPLTPSEWDLYIRTEPFQNTC